MNQSFINHLTNRADKCVFALTYTGTRGIKEYLYMAASLKGAVTHCYWIYDAFFQILMQLCRSMVQSLVSAANNPSIDPQSSGPPHPSLSRQTPTIAFGRVIKPHSAGAVKQEGEPARSAFVSNVRGAVALANFRSISRGTFWFPLLHFVCLTHVLIIWSSIDWWYLQTTRLFYSLALLPGPWSKEHTWMIWRPTAVPRPLKIPSTCQWVFPTLLSILTTDLSRELESGAAHRFLYYQKFKKALSFLTGKLGILKDVLIICILLFESCCVPSM